MLEKWKKVVKGGEDVVVFDFDGPRENDGNPTCLEVTEELLRTKLEDPRFPFGHGYIVAGVLAGITPDKYID